VKKVLVALAAMMSLASASLPSHAADLVYASGPGEQFHGYTVPAIVIRAGDAVTYLNADIANHDVVSDALGPDTAACVAAGYLAGQCPKFWTPLLALGQQSPIFGIDAISAGATLSYRCTIHAAMKGTLAVLPV
jgi:plastocyanin